MWTSAFVLCSGSASMPGLAPSTKKYGDSDLSGSSARARRGTITRASRSRTGAIRVVILGAGATRVPRVGRRYVVERVRRATPVVATLVLALANPSAPRADSD